jgi:hypothetical protein
MSTEPILNNGRCTIAYLYSCYLAMGLHFTIHSTALFTSIHMGLELGLSHRLRALEKSAEEKFVPE